MAVVYGAIGVWALLDPFLNALELGYPSFLNAVGLSISSPIAVERTCHLSANQIEADFIPIPNSFNPDASGGTFAD